MLKDVVWSDIYVEAINSRLTIWIKCLDDTSHVCFGGFDLPFNGLLFFKEMIREKKEKN